MNIVNHILGIGFRSKGFFILSYNAIKLKNKSVKSKFSAINFRKYD